MTSTNFLKCFHRSQRLGLHYHPKDSQNTATLFPLLYKFCLCCLDNYEVYRVIPFAAFIQKLCLTRKCWGIETVNRSSMGKRKYIEIFLENVSL